MIRFSYDKAYRQGEILLFHVAKGTKIETFGRLEKVPSGVIRTGEKEGHEHKLEGAAQLSLMPESKAATPGESKEQPSEGVIDVGKDGATLKHPEHGDIKLPPGKYVAKTQKEATGKNRSQSVKD